MALIHKAPSATFVYPVEVSETEADGTNVVHKFKGVFKRASELEIDRLMDEKLALDKISPANDAEETAKIEKTVAWLRKFTTGWKEVSVHGSEEFSDDNIKTILKDYLGAPWPFFHAFRNGNLGIAAKN